MNGEIGWPVLGQTAVEIPPRPGTRLSLTLRLGASKVEDQSDER